ncbi:hypothetical protein ACK32A_00890 [Aeromonas enteropelogenes]|uniref:hypothetical protein n=1 Tax=Aeromonas enteropelogenes TaxID=29489 RepID=UPI003988FC33
MSYIIAFVCFSESDKEFPVQCFRTDIKSNDDVVIRRTDGKLRLAKVLHTKYLNWDCKGRIECKKSECTFDPLGEVILPKGCPLIYGLSTPELLIKELKSSSGWTQIRSKQRIYRMVLANLNFTSIAYMFFRRNGVDIQIVPRVGDEIVKPYSIYIGSFTEGKVVRHSFAHTTFNLLEGLQRFSNSFLRNENDLERYFVPQGRSDKRTEDLKKQALERKNSRDEMIDIYNACSDGRGGAAYLGDGMWISSDGNLHDWGR